MDRTYRIHIAAEMSGVSEGLIRAWERRYGVLKPRRSPSGYRNYTPADIEVLRRLKQLTEEGVAIAEAVQLLPRLRREAKEAVLAHEGPRRPPDAEQLGQWRDRVLTAAARLDQQRVEEVLDEAMAGLPPVALFDELLAPLLREVGDRWHLGVFTVAEEHLVTQAVKQRVLALLHAAPRRAKRHVVCACFPDEDHELGLLGVALRFRHAGWRVTFLGARTPVVHLGRVVSAVKPDVVALSAVGSAGEAAFRQTLAALRQEVPEGVTVVVGGAAATAHAAVVDALGARRAETAAEWDSLLA